MLLNPSPPDSCQEINGHMTLMHTGAGHIPLCGIFLIQIGVFTHTKLITIILTITDDHRIKIGFWNFTTFVQFFTNKLPEILIKLGTQLSLKRRTSAQRFELMTRSENSLFNICNIMSNLVWEVKHKKIWSLFPQGSNTLKRSPCRLQTTSSP